jgi:hypothetical protein
LSAISVSRSIIPPASLGTIASPARRTWYTAITASSRNPADIASTPATPIVSASRLVSAGPTIAPTVPPAAIGPYNRRATPGVTRSDSRLQNTEITNRLNTDAQT